MDSTPEVSMTPLQAAEFDRSFELLLKLVDLQQADRLAPLGPAAVYTTSVVLWMLVYQRMNAGVTLEKAVLHLLNSAPELCPDNKRVRLKTLSSSTAAYSGARKRLPLEITEWFAREVSQSIIAATPPSLGDRRVFTVDGTTVTLLPVPALRAAFPPATNQYGPGVWPVVNLVVAHELSSGAALQPEYGPMYGPNAISEVKLMEGCLPRMPANSIVMADINFGIFSVAYAIRKQGHSLLARLTEVRFQAHCKTGTLVGEGKGWKTWSCLWRPTSKDRKANPHIPADALLNVLVHEVVVHPNLTLWLVTDLTEPALTLSALYLRRGEVEIDILNFKVVLETENIRARSIPMFHKELLTSVVAYNLVSQLRRQAAALAKVPPKRLSFTGVWNCYQQFLMNSISVDAAVWREKYRMTLYHAMRRKLPNRPNRSFKREAYPQRSKSTQFSKRVPPAPEAPPPTK